MLRLSVSCSQGHSYPTQIIAIREFWRLALLSLVLEVYTGTWYNMYITYCDIYPVRFCVLYRDINLYRAVQKLFIVTFHRKITIRQMPRLCVIRDIFLSS